jgi:hypothetical protein
MGVLVDDDRHDGVCVHLGTCELRTCDPITSVTPTDRVFLFYQGTSYVAWPRLNPPWAILSYEGAGYRSKARGRGSNVLPGLLSASRAAAGTTAELGRKMKATKMEEVELGRKKGSLID